MKAAAVDPYIAMRDAYTSYRAARVKKISARNSQLLIG
jgi:ABC-type transporter lipoprotein component MlaA